MICVLYICSNSLQGFAVTCSPNHMCVVNDSFLLVNVVMSLVFES